VNPVEIRKELHILEKAGTGTHERAKIGEILWDIYETYETCINAFQEIKAISASNLAGGYHAGETVPMAVISRVNRTTRAIHPGSLDKGISDNMFSSLSHFRDKIIKISVIIPKKVQSQNFHKVSSSRC
jgi:hypothetical protein